MRNRKTHTEEHKYFDNILGQNINYLRNARKLSQHDLGKKLGVSYQQVQKYEKAKNSCQAYTMCKIADALEVDVKHLLDPDLIPKAKAYTEASVLNGGEVKPKDFMNNICHYKTPADAGVLKPQEDVYSMEEIEEQMARDEYLDQLKGRH